jgi:Arc/MetJ-type ribon-helix-helix transcriptional regulator
LLPDYYSSSIEVVKLSVSLTSDDVEFLDAYASEAGLPSRSAALHKAVSLLRALQLNEDYQDAWDAWAGSGEGDLWESTSADGLSD